jgi:tRNA modification GTPase
VLVFERPRSFTGEDVVELHLHGSVAVIATVERLLADSGLARPAEAGEFTRRALQNDKMDIAQVEGLGDLLSAETEAQRRSGHAADAGRAGGPSGGMACVAVEGAGAGGGDDRLRG